MFAGLSELKRHQNKDPFNLLKIHVRPAGKRPLLFQGRLAIRGPEAETHETMQKYAKNQISIEKKKGLTSNLLAHGCGFRLEGSSLVAE